MSATQSVATDEQLARVLQIGVVLEELVEARSLEHYRALSDEGVELDEELEEMLLEAQEESGEHRRQLEKLLDELDGDTVPYDEIETLVRQKYGSSRPETVEELLHDQLDGEQTAYTFYDGVIAAIEDAETEFGVDRDRLLSVLRRIRAEEAEGAEEVNEVIESR